ncbi:MAG TPA: AcrB/AcrD/AcrF family protein, partial [Sphingomicrobium sp.]|nr:AcrB/AcrD/AcrF family protein [Sphingomicrobium sp.]
AMVLFWIDDGAQRRRLIAYAVTLGGGVAFSFLVFTSYANRAAVCDALSPVWLSDALLGAGLLLAIAWLTPGNKVQRFALAAAAGAVVAAFHVLAWPQCLSRLEGVSPEVYDLWLSHVREARPVYRHGWQVAANILALPITGMLGWALLAWRNRSDRDLFRRTLAAWAPAIAALLLLAWQTRTGPAAQMLALTGGAALVWVLAPLAASYRHFPAQLLALAAVAVIGLGGLMPLASNFIPAKKVTAREISIATANRRCNFIGSFRPIHKLPKGTVFTFLDTSPRLITVTHHRAITGPYHRNGEQIADVMKAFRGSAEQARAIVAKYRADYVMTCPNASTTTIFLSEAPNGFYAQLSKGQVPAWLTSVELPKDSPFRIWRVAR